MATLEMGN